MPRTFKPRQRRLDGGEFNRLKAASTSTLNPHILPVAKSRSWYAWPTVCLAVETAIISGRILGL